MTVPQGAKIIVNKYRHRCYGCKGWVEVGDGASILDVNITGKWETFHKDHLPQPYVEGDIAAPYTGPRHHRPGAKPRCSQCQHWQADHQMAGCVGRFPGAPTTCLCPGWNGVPGTGQVIAPTVVANGCTVHTPAFDKTCEDCWVSKGSNRIAARQLALQYRAGVFPANKPIPQAPVPTIVVFYGPIRSASDGQEHFIGADAVADLHSITTDVKSKTNVLFVGPADKRTFKMPTGDVFVVGPHYEFNEYATAAQGLADWLAQRGI